MSGRERIKERNKPADISKNANEKKDAASNENEASERTNPQWKLLTGDQINMLLDLSVDQVQLQFEEILQLKNHQTCLNEAALLDYYVSGFWWAKEMNFTCQQISFIMALLQLLLDNIREKQMPFIDNFKEFAKTVFDTRQSPLFEMEANPLLDVDQVKSIIDYFKTSLFQHYRLYEFLFTQTRDEQLLGMERTIEVINSADFVAPLEEGMPTDVFLRYMVPSPVEQSDTGVMERQAESGDEPGGGEQEEEEGGCEGFSLEDVREVLGQMAEEMLGDLQAEFTEKLRIQEEAYSTRIEHLKNGSSK